MLKKAYLEAHFGTFSMSFFYIRGDRQMGAGWYLQRINIFLNHSDRYHGDFASMRLSA